MPETATAADPNQPSSRLGAEAVALLRRLIQFNTVNPPGNEGPAIEYLRSLLSAAGWECQVLARAAERPNLVAWLRGAEPGPSFGLISHVDTVPADPAEWDHDPWTGHVADGHVWGRGALDMKDQVASETAACLALAREGWRPARGDMMLLVTADEETGAHFGAQWLCEAHPEAVRCDMIVNEGAGEMARFDGRRLFTLAVGEKGVFRFRIHARGVAGHGSIPGVGENALLKLAPALARLDAQPPREGTPDTDLFLERLLGPEHGGAERGLEEIRRIDPHFAALLAEPMLGVTLAPTMAKGAPAPNMIPSNAELTVDCRVPPEMGEREVRERIEGVIGTGDWEIEFIDPVVGNRSDYEGPLSNAIETWVKKVDPGAEVLPMVMPGFSDSHWFRQAFDATVFGFCPQNTMPLTQARSLVHGANERVPIADVELQADCFYSLPKLILGSAA